MRLGGRQWDHALIGGFEPRFSSVAKAKPNILTDGLAAFDPIARGAYTPLLAERIEAVAGAAGGGGG